MTSMLESRIHLKVGYLQSTSMQMKIARSIMKMLRVEASASVV